MKHDWQCLNIMILIEKPEWDVELADNEQTERLITHLDELMQEVIFMTLKIQGNY